VLKHTQVEYKIITPWRKIIIRMALKILKFPLGNVIVDPMIDLKIWPNPIIKLNLNIVNSWLVMKKLYSFVTIEAP